MGDGAEVLSSVEVEAIEVSGGVAVGVVARADGGGAVRVRARRAVVLAASAIQTPALLLASRIRQGPVGRHLQGHPGVSVSGRFGDAVRAWEGATQGHEVIGLRGEGLKFEALGYGNDLAVTRLPGVGSALAQEMERLDHWLQWGVAVRARSEGRVRRVLGRTVVTWSLHPEDVARFRRGVAVLVQLMFRGGG